MAATHRIRVIDSHTGGEPTRLVLEGGPELGAGPLSGRVKRFRDHFDAWRTAIVNEPRGSDTVVGALLVPPHEPDCQFGVIFFNNVGPLGMCGHGTIGLVASLAHLGRVTPGRVRIDTPVGVVEAELQANGDVSVNNVASYRKAKGVVIDVPGLGQVQGDIAWGGNWFFLVENHGLTLTLGHLAGLMDYTVRVLKAVNAQGFPEVDHIELFTASPCSAGVPPASESGLAHEGQAGLLRYPKPDSRNFVLCPGLAYDRSPCGTGTSAKLACLAADGKLAEGAAWVQESVIGSTFTGHYRWLDRAKGEVAPTITGAAFITAETTQLLDARDPFCWGIAPERRS